MASAPPIGELLEQAQQNATDGIIRSDGLSRSAREALERAGWLRRIIRGWYLLLKPTDELGATTAWYASFWTFVSLYLESRLGEDYCLSAESSLDLHLGPTQIPEQTVIIAGRGGSGVVELPEKLSLLTYQQSKTLPGPQHIERIMGVRVMVLPLALIRAAPTFLEKQPESAEIALRMLQDPSELIRILVEGAHVTASERLAGAFEFIGERETAQRITTAMEATGHRIQPKNPIVRERPILVSGTRVRSAYAARVEARWARMRDDVLTEFSVEPGPFDDPTKVLASMEVAHVQDAYHSLSIEGYQVTPDLIRRIKEGQWEPDSNQDRPERNALAAKGYREAFELVKQSVGEIMAGESPATNVIKSIQPWYQALFSPSVAAGLVSPADLAGYRSGPVYIRGAQHVPPPRQAISDAMEAYADRMAAEESAIVRAILGHFLFAWIHPFPDGNGRIARFVMNTMLVTAGFPWTVVRVDNRDGYMKSLDAASSAGDIKPFARHIATEARASLLSWNSE